MDGEPTTPKTAHNVPIRGEADIATCAANIVLGGKHAYRVPLGRIRSACQSRYSFEEREIAYHPRKIIGS